jgi:hypothetical protein
VRHSETSGERGSNVRRARGLQRSQAMTAERGRAISRERGVAMTAERGRAIGSARALATTAERSQAGERGLAMTAERRQATTGQRMKAHQIKGQLGSHPRQSSGQSGQTETRLVYARANDRNAGAGLNAEQRARLREILAARRDIPRVSNLSDIRVNAVIPRSVRLAAIPEEVVRIYPRFRRHQAFIYRNEMVVVDPLTSRIVAVLPA